MDLSYVDVKELTTKQITRGIDNNHWIFTKRVKTDETVKVPILPQAMTILEKYRDSLSEALLPPSSNQKTKQLPKENSQGLRYPQEPDLPCVQTRLCDHCHAIKRRIHRNYQNYWVTPSYRPDRFMQGP